MKGPPARGQHIRLSPAEGRALSHDRYDVRGRDGVRIFDVSRDQAAKAITAGAMELWRGPSGVYLRAVDATYTALRGSSPSGRPDLIVMRRDEPDRYAAVWRGARNAHVGKGALGRRTADTAMRFPREGEVMEKFFEFSKFDERTGTITGLLTSGKLVDKEGERLNYPGGGKAAFQYWQDQKEASTRAASQEKSSGNVRVQHTTEIGGKVTKITYDDIDQTIFVEIKPLNERILEACRKGFFTGLSPAGRYGARNCEECGADMLGQGNYCQPCGKKVVVTFVPIVAEVSLVDNPCLAAATFTYVGATGATELRKFAPRSTMKDHLIKFHKGAAKSNESLAASEKELAKSNPANAAIHKGRAEDYAALGRNHTQCADNLSAMSDVDGDTDKMAKSSVAEDFFKNFYQPAQSIRQSPSGGLFDPNDTASLFK